MYLLSILSGASKFSSESKGFPSSPIAVENYCSTSIILYVLLEILLANVIIETLFVIPFTRSLTRWYLKKSCSRGVGMRMPIIT